MKSLAAVLAIIVGFLVAGPARAEGPQTSSRPCHAEASGTVDAPGFYG